MNMLAHVLLFAAILAFDGLGGGPPASVVQAKVVLTGQISDSLCKSKHEEAAEDQGKMSDHDCTVACVRGGSKYVLLADDKVYGIANQSFGDLAAMAGQKVKITGELSGDEITISKIEKT